MLMQTEIADELPAPEAVRGQFDLAGSVAFVTGAASGLGRAIAWGFACHGADVVIADRDETGANCVAEQIRQLGRSALPVRVDVTQEHDVEATVARALEAYGRIDIGVNNAGNNCRKPVLELSPAHFGTPLTRQLSPEARAAVTDQSPQHRFAVAPEIIGPAVLLASRASSFITGTSILVDGGWTAR
jgi:NAD(P)-dependent dehydrogenase (short-subunit alcohol dehydrogenase family)